MHHQEHNERVIRILHISVMCWLFLLEGVDFGLIFLGLQISSMHWQFFLPLKTAQMV